MSYIVCQKKRNNPRMDVRICEKKCDIKDECEEYLSAAGSIKINVPLSEGIEPVHLEAA